MPIRSASCLRNTAYPVLWNVVIGHLMPKLLFILSRNSPTALFVNEITNISSGFMLFLSMRYFTLAATVVVFPAPAPAMTRV